MDRDPNFRGITIENELEVERIAALFKGSSIARAVLKDNRRILLPSESRQVVDALLSSAQDRTPWNSPMWEQDTSILRDYEEKTGLRLL